MRLQPVQRPVMGAESWLVSLEQRVGGLQNRQQGPLGVGGAGSCRLRIFIIGAMEALDGVRVCD